MSTEELLDSFIQKNRGIVREEIKILLAERLYAPSEAIKLFNPVITKVTLQKWTDKGLIPEQRIGGRIFYKYSDILDAGAITKKYKR